METAIQQVQNKNLTGFQQAALETFSIVRHLLSTEEREIIEVFTGSETIGRVISHSDDQTVSDLFRKTCMVCMVVSGIKVHSETDAIDPITEKFLFDYITKQYGNFTFPEIEKAFYFNSIGKLEHRIEHYGAFDTTFVSKVMEAWLILKSRTRQRAVALIPPPPPPRETTAEESYHGLIDYHKKHGQFPVSWSWNKVFEHMEANGIIKLSLKEKKKFYKETYQKMSDHLESMGITMRMNELRSKRESLEDDVALECRKLMVQKFLPAH